MNLIYREQLDALAVLGCGMPDCPQPHDHSALYFRSKCHSVVGSNKVSYKDGILSILCAACEKPIVSIPVASRDAGERVPTR